MTLDAVVAIDVVADFFGSLQQLGRMGKAVVALAEGFPFALFDVQLVQFVELPFQTLTLDNDGLGVFLRLLEGFFRIDPVLIKLSDGFRLRFAARKCVQQFALGGFLIEGMVGVLPVDVDKLPADGFKLRQRGCLIIDKAAAFPFGIDDAADAEFFRVFVQKTLLLQLGFKFGQKADVKQCRQLRFLRAAADLAVIGLIAQQKPDCVQRNRFARACLAGQNGKTTLEIQIEVFNNDKIAQGKCQQHGSIP